LTDVETIAAALKECAETISYTDCRMLAIRKQIEENAGEPTEEEILFEKMRKLDLPIE
jgi:ppGpp synthetase/RelA/SpoT-type nucleotidyltranferase